VTRQTRVQRRLLTGTLQEPGGSPRVVQLNLDTVKEEDDSVTVTDTAYTVEGKKYILVDDDTAAGAVTITLPPAIDSTDRIIVVKKIGSTGAVTVDGNASETIDGATTQVISAQYDAMQVVSDGANWFII
jgi:hypothetical protein